ncbi:uncharacterized protein LOC124131647 [Haliotis rufescens]|uniref:uncharacterized protein LOC124131647 n=1 Tax=Haliotis rufescens TaxID=6454 RepID=UPI001EAFA86E|nr:uncharacterized protein LOC124131647 [Haliotis rufescens]
MDVDSWITVTILVDLIALVFQIGAYASPMWAWAKEGTRFRGVALWYTVSCGEPCVPIKDAELNATLDGIQDSHVEFLVLRVLQSVGLAGILALTVFLIVYKIGYSGRWGSMKTANLASFILCIFTILDLLASAILFGVKYYNFFLFVESFDSSSIPWSALMSFLACLILIIVCLFIKLKCKPEHVDGASLPVSRDVSKMNLHPHVQNGTGGHRYYNQTPYMDDRSRYNEDNRPIHNGGMIRGYEDFDDRRNNSQYYPEARNPYETRHNGHYENRGYQPEPEPAVLYKPASSQFKDNRDRELGHTIYTGTGFSYLKGEVNRGDRDDSRYGRPMALADYSHSTNRGHDDYYESSRIGRPPIGGSRVLPSNPNAYVYRPHQY